MARSISKSLKKMASKEDDIKANYAKNLKAADYMDLVAEEFKDGPEVYRFILTFIHDVLKSGRFGGSTALEIGSASVVHHIAPVSAYFKNIVMSDYVEDNCNELKKWLQGKSSKKQFLDQSAEVEGHGKDLETVKKSIEERIRTRVKHVVRGDMLLDGILMEEVPLNSSPPYNLILASDCLESAAVDLKSYTQICKRINKLLRPGGGLVAFGSIRGKSWKVKNVDFHNLEIGEGDVVNALKEAGFGEIDMKTVDPKIPNYDYDGTYCVAATKMK